MTSSIKIVTGLPGNGKTLYAIKMVKEWAEKEKRPVFYHGIEILDPVALPWTAIDPEKWYDAPPGAIIIIDECQIIFRPRSLGKEPPPYVARLETLRHQGLDMVLITQHPMLCDTAIRRLTGKHLHCIRKWGTESSTIHEWASVRDNCDKPAGRKDSIKHAFKFDKSIYAMYKSAEVHTIKRSIPKRLIMLFILPFVLIALGYLVYYMMIGKKLEKNPQVAGQIVAQQGGSISTTREKEKWEDPIADAMRFAYDSTPRITGLAHTAPKYDAVTQPTTAPMPVSCVASKTKCSCYSQQATIMAVEEITCRSIVARGYFVDFELDRDKQAEQRHVDQVVGKLNEQETERRQEATSNNEDGYGVLGRRGQGVRKPSFEQKS